jgi:hypothetical protein
VFGGAGNNMTLKNVLSAIRRLFDQRGESRRASPQANPSDDDYDDYDGHDSDNFDPFPDPVVIEFQDVLDLHSIPPAYVKAVVEDYLKEAHKRSVKRVRIIHGKGIGVQREIVRSILAKTSYVVDFGDAPANAGGWGATVVTLKPKRVK